MYVLDSREYHESCTEKNNTSKYIEKMGELDIHFRVQDNISKNMGNSSLYFI